ncbi:unnamed protein product [Phytomonas sp. Hart1]|nr:unnamed protein product [Phytomonas sp. Hart1]|eukprot:CCW68477.1 unnamed protein product [Phytomonas sp. isolate Hart1]
MSTSVRDQLERIEEAYFYEPGRLSEVNAISGTVSPRRVGITRPICLVSGNGNRPLAEAVALLLGKNTHNTSVTQYANGEVNIRINENVLGADVHIIQSTAGNNLININTSIMELMFLIRKMRLSNAKSITAIVPFFGYTRRGHKKDSQGLISASMVARMIVQMGVDRIATLDLHSGQIQGFFDNVPLDNLSMTHEFARYLRKQPWFDLNRVALVSPDAGGVDRMSKLADILHVKNLVTIVKRNITIGGEEGLQAVGEVNGLHCVIIDDMIDTGETVVMACNLLKSLGAARVMACCTHGVITDPCQQRINDCTSLSELVVSDSIPQEEKKKCIPKLKVLTIAPLIAIVIDKYTREESLSSMFDSPLVM